MANGKNRMPSYRRKPVSNTSLDWTPAFAGVTSCRNWLLLTFTICHLPFAMVFAVSDNAGTKNGNFLKIATDARGVALGDSVVSMAKGADALRWNPAAL